MRHYFETSIFLKFIKMQKHFLLFLFLLVTTASFAQPFYVQTNIAGVTAPVDLTKQLNFRTSRIQATSNLAAGVGTWQWFGKTVNIQNPGTYPALDTAIWRCSKPNQILPFNTVAEPALGQPSAIRHNNRGGFAGKMPAVTAGNYYTFNIRNGYPVPLVGYSSAILETNYEPVIIDNAKTFVGTCVKTTPTSVQYYSNDTVGIQAQFGTTALHPGENMYVALSIDGFISTEIEQMTATSPGRAKYTIPSYAYQAGSTVQYYIFTSPRDLNFLRNNIKDIDLYSLSINKNIYAPTFTPLYYKILYSYTSYSFRIAPGWKSRNPFCLAYNRNDTLRLYPVSLSSAFCDSTGTISYTWRAPSGATRVTNNVDTVLFAGATTGTVVAGVYSVTATCSSLGCSASASIDMTVYPEINPHASALVLQSACNGSAVLGAAPTGGAPPYTYQWYWGALKEGALQNQLAASKSTHGVVVTDANGCTSYGTATAGDNPNIQEPLIAANICVNPQCFGASDGVVGLAMLPCTGTSCNYSYSWSNPTGSPITTPTPVRYGMRAGTYTVTITNTYSGTSTCSKVITLSIYDPPQLMVSLKTAPTCYKNGTTNTGQIKAVATGGYNPKPRPNPVTGVDPPDFPYYKWKNNSGNIIASGAEDTVTLPQTIKNLASGCYFVTITDARYCTATSSICIDSTFTLQTTALSPPVCIDGLTGKASVTCTPSKSDAVAYTYYWSQPTSNNGYDVAAYLSAGTQTVTVTTPNGCKASATVVIAPGGVPLTFTLGSSPTAYTCAGQQDGSVYIQNPAGDPDPRATYTYRWQQIGATTVNFASKNATIYNIRGNFIYQVTVTSTHGCTQSASIMIPQPTTTISPQSATQNVKCKGDNNGGMNVTIASGSVSAFTYNWFKDGVAIPPPSPPNAGSGLSAGVYGVEITENSTGCKGYADGLIQEPTSQLTASVVPGSIRGTTCFGGNDGSVNIQTQGGTPLFSPPYYTFTWSPQGVPFIPNPQNLEALTYSVTVRDTNNCTVTVPNIVIPGPTQPMSFDIATRNKACGVEPTGKICVVNIQNASPPYTFNWSGAAQTDSCATMLLAGNYNVTVTDSKNCTASANTTIPSVAVDLIVRDSSINCGQRSVVPFVATNTIDPFSISWSPAAGISNINEITPTITPAATTNYTVSISKNGCTLDKNVKITVNYCNGYSVPTAFMPGGTQAENHHFKPLGNGFTVKAFRIFNRWGQLIYDNASGDGWDGTFNGEQQPAGTYVYIIEYSNQANETKQDSGEITLLR